jgi:class 3 adenylate cyclase/tetratricopeptide (TPR) repeat protein
MVERGDVKDGSELSPSRHVPRIALDWVVDEPDRLWRLVDGTMVFADISGFTALSERLATKGRIGAEELVETLSRVFGSMLDTAASRGGQLLKFGGDALLFLFDGDDHARQGASTAVEMRAALRQASEIVTSVGRLSLSVSIGVHTGQFHLFLVGSSHRELVVLGPGTSAVVSAENAAEAGQIVLSPGAAAALDPSDVRDRGDGALLLKWRRAPVEPSGPKLARPTDREAAHRLLPAILATSFEDAMADPAHRVATISFMKFSGTDALLAELGPDVLAERLHETISIAQAAFIDEDIALLCVDCDADGGKIFSSAGVPLTSEDDEGRMLRAAQVILAAHPPLPLQIGINRGHVFAAEVGTPRRASYSAMGDTTNTAARICGKSQKGQIYVHPEVLEHARTMYESEPVGPFTFKGKALPQVLYAVRDEIGIREQSTGTGGPFVGRTDELATLRTLIDGTLDGHGGAVTVSGPVGIGKSRLVDEALASWPTTGVIAMHAEPYGMTNSYRVFRDPIRALLGVHRGTHAEMGAELLATVRHAAPHLEPWLALIADVAQIDVDPSDDVLALLPRFRPDRTADVVIELLELFLTGAVVFRLEDAHWADEPSAHLAMRLAGAAHTHPWAVVAVRRDEPGGIELDKGRTVDVAPLTSEDLRELVHLQTEASPLRPHEVDLIVERAGGNPLFASELISALRAVGDADAVPSSLQGALVAQVDALDPFSRRVLSYGSVLGRSFRRSVLTAVLAREQVVVDEATIDRLGGFIEADGPDRWRFRNGLVRDVTYDGLGFRLRERLHLEAGEAIESISDDPAVDADVLALHFSEGSDHARAFHYSELAAQRAERSFAFPAAIGHLERAVRASRRLPEVTSADRAELLVRLGVAQDQAGLLDEALDTFTPAVRLIDDPVRRGEVRLLRAQVREHAAAYPSALREATQVRSSLAHDDAPRARQLRARCAAFRALVRQRQERVEAALRAAMVAVEEAERAGEHGALARALSVLSWARLVSGDEDFLADAMRALELFAEVGDLSGQAKMANNLGVSAYFDGDWNETLRLYAQAEAASRAIGDVTDAALAATNTGEVMVNQGRLDEAEPLLRDAARVLRASGHVLWACYAEMHLGRLFIATGDLARAEAILRRCVDENVELGSSASAFESSIHLAECLVRSGRADEALALIEMRATTTTEDVSILEASRALVEAHAYATLGVIDRAAERIVTGVAAARRRELEFDLARLLLLADEMGVDAEPVGSARPREEAEQILCRLGVTG